MSTAASARYGVDCPACGAGQDEPCRTLTTRRVTDTHRARLDAVLRERWLRKHRIP